ncbi:Salicylate hydroxylase [Pantoea sp. AS-PWVM4]|uniref:FAD-dependent monooxygenase n=1 Tax=Pantoea sp. AS-PWVM4 TaxID=1332069 RepID=UPI0003AC7BC4|nr:FAD-dependent monooxygenase [Pantoea sp. AS-PWVM4]ERK16289.1 Salicylate hydroxylase [Pantoea sp. AS-PWVM4]
MNTVKKVLIAGGGIGGLSLALALSTRGVETTLIEKRPDFNVPGVGLGQPTNALRVYQEFGLIEEILDAGFSYNHMSIFDPQRQLIVEHRFRMGGQGLPAFCALSRKTLHDILYQRAQKAGVKFRFNTEIQSFNGQHGSEVILSDGSCETFDVVAGFDGIRSSTRQHIVGDMFGPMPSGIGAWRVQVPRPSEVTGMEFLQGVGGKVGAIPISQDKMYLFNIRPEDPARMFAQDEMHLLMKERLSQFGGYVADIAESLTVSSPIVYGALEPFIVPYPWNKGRVVIGGDAAHVVPPHLTAGAAMAVEDAWVLAKYLLSSEGSVEDRLNAYGRERYARNAFVYIFARSWMESEQSVKTAAELESAKLELARNADARITVADNILNEFHC